jgi:hypothetical protein
LRPENLSLLAEKNESAIAGIVALIENIGSEAIVHLLVGQDKAAIKFRCLKYCRNLVKVFVTPARGNLYIFAKETG